MWSSMLRNRQRAWPPKAIEKEASESQKEPGAKDIMEVRE